MALKARYNVSLPDHVSGELERHAKAVRATPTEYAGDIIRWWFGQGCPPVTPDEIELRKRVGDIAKKYKPVPSDFHILQLDEEVDYKLIDGPVEAALVQLGMPNLFSQEKEYDSVRMTVAYDNHPTHWLVFNFFKGSGRPGGDGLSLYGYSKRHVGKKVMLKKLEEIAKEMKNEGPIEFSQIPSLEPTRANHK